MRKSRKVAAIAVAITGAGAAILAGSTLGAQTGCTLQGTCDPSTVYVPSFPIGTTSAPYTTVQAFQPDAGVFYTGEGAVWLSSPVDGTWMDFPGQRSYVLYPTWPDGGPFVGQYLSYAWVSADQNPGTNPNSNWAPSAGNIAEFTNLPDGGNTGIIVTNDTCTEYFLQVMLVQQTVTGAATPDAGDAAAPIDAPAGD